MTRDVGDHGDFPYPTPPQVIPDWRRLQRGYPKPSQIGIDFSDSVAIGVGFTEPLCVPQPALSDPKLAKRESNGCPLWFKDWFLDFERMATIRTPPLPR